MTPSHKTSNGTQNPTSLIRRFSLIATLILGMLTFGTSWAAEPSQAVNINTASAELIAETLSGIGLKKAQAIVDWRENHGKFTHKEQLTAIKGIGQATLAKNDNLIALE